MHFDGHLTGDALPFGVLEWLFRRSAGHDFRGTITMQGAVQVDFGADETRVVIDSTGRGRRLTGGFGAFTFGGDLAWNGKLEGGSPGFADPPRFDGRIDAIDLSAWRPGAVELFLARGHWSGTLRLPEKTRGEFPGEIALEGLLRVHYGEATVGQAGRDAAAEPGAPAAVALADIEASVAGTPLRDGGWTLHHIRIGEVDESWARASWRLVDLEIDQLFLGFSGEASAETVGLARALRREEGVAPLTLKAVEVGGLEITPGGARAAASASVESAASGGNVRMDGGVLEGVHRVGAELRAEALHARDVTAWSTPDEAPAEFRLHALDAGGVRFGKRFVRLDNVRATLTARRFSQLGSGPRPCLRRILAQERTLLDLVRGRLSLGRRIAMDCPALAPLPAP